MSELGQRRPIDDVIEKDQRFSFGEQLLLIAGCVSVIILLVAALGGP